MNDMWNVRDMYTLHYVDGAVQIFDRTADWPVFIISRWWRVKFILFISQLLQQLKMDNYYTKHVVEMRLVAKERNQRKF